jgi:hypothetical protein
MSEDEQECRFRQHRVCRYRHSHRGPGRARDLGAVVVALAVAGCTAASAQTYENEAGAGVRFYGQVSPVWQRFDDGGKATRNLVDNGNSNTRMGFVIARPIGDNILTLTVETALGVLQTSEVSQGEHSDRIDWKRMDLRKFDGAFSGHFGTLYAGQGSMATDGAATLDASGTTLSGTVTFDDSAGSFAFRGKDGVLTDITIGRAFKSFDGGRRFRLRYDTPSWSGFSAAVSYGHNILAEDDQTAYFDMALRWTGTANDFELAAAAGFAWAEPELGDTVKSYMGSATVLHTPTGLNLSIAGGAQLDAGSYGYIRGGWRGDPLPVGQSAVSVDYYSGTDVASDGANSKGWGIYAQQTFDGLGLEVYAGWRSYAYKDSTPVEYQHAKSVLLGGRYQF